MAGSVVLIGYSGHAFVVGEVFQRAGFELKGYCDWEEKKVNPFQIPFLGPESGQLALEVMKASAAFVAIGSNTIRAKVYHKLVEQGVAHFPSAIDPSAIISRLSVVGNSCIIAPKAIINPLANIEHGVICNTGSIIEHECQIGAFSHIAPGATLAGNVQVGKYTMIGANAVVKQGIKIGANVIVGAGAVVIRDIPDHSIYVGNPAKLLKQNL